MAWNAMSQRALRARQPRALFRGWVEIVADGSRRRATAHDLSVAGIGIEMKGALPDRAQRVVSEFALPGIGLPLALEGEVAWADAEVSRVGIRFVDLDPGLAELLESYVAGRL
jgi:hypothetical protein